MPKWRQAFYGSRRKEDEELKKWWKRVKNMPWRPAYAENRIHRDAEYVYVGRGEVGRLNFKNREKKKVFDPFYGGYSFI